MSQQLPWIKTDRPETFGRVAVLLGGASAERKISLKSGAAVVAALQASGVDAQGVDAVADFPAALAGFDRVFNALHGRGGEDGVVQGLLQSLGLPYTGSGVLGSALAMDKMRCKQMWQGMGLSTPPFATVCATSDLSAVVEQVGLPLMVKPSREGSSIGMARVDRVDQLAAAVERAAVQDSVVLAERWVSGPEYTVAVLGGEALPVIRLETPRTFYDYAAKYSAEDTRYLSPCGLSATAEAALQTVSLRAFESVGAAGWGRVDLLCDESGTAWLLEVNTVPGLTDHSLVPMAAKAAGLSFEQLVWRILEESLEVRP